MAGKTAKKTPTALRDIRLGGGGGENGFFFYIEQLETECGTHEELPSGVVRLLCVSVSVCVCVCVIVKDRLMAD